LDVVVELGYGSDHPDARMARITEWLETRSDIQSWKMGEEFDLWHGDFQEVEGEDEQQDAN
jgi:uncharacterized protein YggL (DUF469 family)